MIEPSPRFEKVKDLGSGNFGLARLERDKETGELVAIKYIERGEGIDENVAREIVNHRMLRHANIVMFKEVILTPTHLGIVMEYAAGGELFDRICAKGRFSEDEARYFFKQLIAGVAYCHAQSVAHRDLKLENALLDGSEPPLLKICDFGYSKSSLLHSMANSTVGTPAYIAPEVLRRTGYDGRTADAWSCGVTLFVMLVGGYPFEDPAKPKDFRATIARIMARQYAFPAGLPLSDEVRDLFDRIFVIDPLGRLTVEGIAAHAWCTGGGPPPAWLGSAAGVPAPPGLQGAEDINRMVAAARAREPGAPPRAPQQPAVDSSGGGGDDFFDDELGGEDDAGFD